MKTCDQAFALIFVVAIAGCGSGAAQQSDNGGETTSTSVRSAVLKTKGSISGEFRPVELAAAKILGRCDPDTFANFGVNFESEGWRKVGVTVMSKDEIEAGQTGSIPLDWVAVSFMDAEYNATEFRGPAELVLLSNDPDAPRMSGTVKGTIPGYSGLAGGGKPVPEESIEIDFAFDINAACGV